MEITDGSDGATTKISDSAYSNSCSNNSQSQRSGSSKSRHSGSNSSGSSGYGGKASLTTNKETEAPQPLTKRYKGKEHKKKKPKSTPSSSSSSGTPTITSSENESKEKVETDTTLPSNESNDEQMKESSMKESNVNTENDLPNKEDFSAPPVAASTFPTVCDVKPIVKTVSVEEKRECLSPLKCSTDNSLNINQQSTATDLKLPTVITGEGFSCVVSMFDGVVLYANASLSNSLGYPKDMWIGRSFIDFLHPKDRPTFSSQITTGVALPLAESSGKNCEKTAVFRTGLFCRIRQYRGLKLGGKLGFGVQERDVKYSPFQLALTFRKITDCENSGMYLVITASPVVSPYIGKENRPQTKTRFDKFTTRHTATGVFSHMDKGAVAHLGYFSQDIVGKSVFDFYHPEDMPYIKEVYKYITKKEKTLSSKPYRFCAQNGDYVTLETDWSSFINPWSRKLEFVIGHHSILQGPENPDVFQIANAEKTKRFPEDVLRQSRIIKDEILRLMAEILIKTTETVKQLVSKRCMDLALFMESLLEDSQKTNEETQFDNPHGTSLSISIERDSVMLGEISPHHDYYDSSIETPPSYNQLNYNENIQRFFESHPWTANRDDISSTCKTSATSVNKAKINCLPTSRSNAHSSLQRGSGESGSSNDLYNFSHRKRPPNIPMRNISPVKDKNKKLIKINYKPTYLTEELLTRHNSEMEKEMAKKHKEARSVSKSEVREKSERKGNKLERRMQQITNPQIHGVKRSSSLSWDLNQDNPKICKTHAVPESNFQRFPQKNTTCRPINNFQPTVLKNPPNIQNIPSTSQYSSPMTNTTPADPVSNTYAGMYPAIYLIPSQQGVQQEQPPMSQPMPQLVQPMPQLSQPIPQPMTQPMRQPMQQPTQQPITQPKYPYKYLMYPPTMYGTQQLVYPPVAIAYPPLPLSSNSLPTGNIPNRPIGGRPVTNIPVDSRHVGNRLMGNRAIENRSLDNRYMGNISTENRSVGLINGGYHPMPPNLLADLTSTVITKSNIYPPLSEQKHIKLESHCASLKAEPGSGVDSLASTSIMNRLRTPPSRNLSIVVDNYESASSDLTSDEDVTSYSTSLHSSVSKIDSFNSNDRKYRRRSMHRKKKSRTSQSSNQMYQKNDTYQKNIVYQKNAAYSKRDNMYQKHDMYQKNETYPKGDMYQKNETYQKGDIYQRHDVYQKHDMYKKNDVYQKQDMYKRNDVYQKHDNIYKKHDFYQDNDMSQNNDSKTSKWVNKEQFYKYVDSSQDAIENRMENSNSDDTFDNDLYFDDNIMNTSNADSISINVLPDDEDSKQSKILKNVDPPWLEQVCVTSDLIYKYQMAPKDLSKVLHSDKLALNQLSQSSLVNEQLSQLYDDLRMQGKPPILNLEADFNCSSSDEETNLKKKSRRNFGSYGNLVILFEDEAPLPTPR